MADLYNLADPTVEEELQEADEEPTHQEWDVAETVELPPALEDAAKHKALLGDDDEDVTNELTTSTTKVLDQHLSINQSYLKLQKMWTQEMCSQEILHFDEDVFAEIVRRINEAEEYIETTSSGNFQGNAIKNALFTSVISVDLERSKFLICSLLKHRLHKIEAFPYYMRDHSDRLRESEIAYLKEYLSMVEEHLQNSVVNHFPQSIWKNLDDEGMIDEPDLDTYVFITTRESIFMVDEQESYPARASLVVKYSRVRDFVHDGKVELLM